MHESTSDAATLRDEVNQLRAYASQKESEIRQLNTCLQGLQSDMELVKTRAGKIQQNSENYRKQKVDHFKDKLTNDSLTCSSDL